MDVSPPAPYDNEHGNRPHPLLLIDGQGTKISLSMLSFVMASGDPANTLGWADNFAHPTDDDDALRWGLDAAGNVLYNAGESSTVLVDKIALVGPGNAFFGTLLTTQEVTDDVSHNVPWVRWDFEMTGVNGQPLAQTSLEIPVAPIPEPATMVLLGTGMLFLGRQIRRKLGQKPGVAKVR